MSGIRGAPRRLQPTGSLHLSLPKGLRRLYLRRTCEGLIDFRQGPCNLSKIRWRPQSPTSQSLHTRPPRNPTKKAGAPATARTALRAWGSKFRVQAINLYAEGNPSIECAWATLASNTSRPSSPACFDSLILFSAATKAMNRSRESISTEWRSGGIAPVLLPVKPSSERPKEAQYQATIDVPLP